MQDGTGQYRLENRGTVHVLIIFSRFCDRVSPSPYHGHRERDEGGLMRLFLAITLCSLGPEIQTRL